MAFNPMFKSIEKEGAREVELTTAASYKGIALKTLFLVFLTIISATLVGVFGIVKNAAGVSGTTVYVKPWLYGVLGVCGIVSLVSLIIGSIFPKTAVAFGPIYAICEGAVAGTLTVFLNIVLKWGAFLAIGATITIFLVTLLFNLFASFRAKAVVTKILSIMFTAIIIFFIAYLIIALVKPSLFNSQLNNISPKASLGIAIGITAFFIIYGTFLLSAQFTRAEIMVKSGMEKKYEWSAAFGILFALILIYLEVVRLLLILFGSRK